MRAATPSARRCSRAAAALACLLLTLGGACSASPPVVAAPGIVIGVDVSRDTDDQAAADAVAASVRGFIDSRYHGRLEGVAITVRVLDDSTRGRPDPAAGEANLRAFVADPRVLGVIGPLQSSIAAAEIPVAAAAHLPLVSPSNSSGCLTRPAPDCDDLAARLRGSLPVSYFRLMATDDLVGEAATALAVGLPLRALAVGSDGGTYGKGLADQFAPAFRAAGGTVVVRSDLDPHARGDVDGFLRAAAAGGAKGVFFGGRDAGGACLVRAAMSEMLPPETAFLGGEGLAGPACLKDLGPVTANTIAVLPGPATDGALAAGVADATGVLLAAISRALKANGGNVPTREEVRRQLAQGTYTGHWGRFGFDGNGDTTLRLYTAWSVTGTPPTWTPLKPIQLANSRALPG